MMVEDVLYVCVVDIQNANREGVLNMEILGANAILVGGLSVIVLGLVEWFKTANMPTWAIRLISLGLSYAVLGLSILYAPMTWQMFVLNGASIFLLTNGIFHTASTASSKEIETIVVNKDN